MSTGATSAGSGDSEDEAVPVAPDLEDAYLTIIQGSRRPAWDDITEATG